jgi:hypothetical protein
MDLPLYFPDEIWLYHILCYLPLHWRGRTWALLCRRAAAMWHLAPCDGSCDENRIPPSQLARFARSMTSFYDDDFHSIPRMLVPVYTRNAKLLLLELARLREPASCPKLSDVLFSLRDDEDDMEPRAPPFFNDRAREIYCTFSRYIYYVTHVHSMPDYEPADLLLCQEEPFGFLLSRMPLLCDWSLCRNLTSLSIHGNYIPAVQLCTLVLLTRLDIQHAGVFTSGNYYDSTTFESLTRLTSLTINCMCILSAKLLTCLPLLNTIRFSPSGRRLADGGVIDIPRIEVTLNTLLPHPHLRRRAECMAERYSDDLAWWAQALRDQTPKLRLPNNSNR